MVYQVGSPAMFEGNMFLPETGTPIWKMLRSKTVFELCEPEPLTVATCMLMSLTIRCLPVPPADPRGTTSVVAIPTPSFSVSRQNLSRGLWNAEEEPTHYTAAFARQSRPIARLEPEEPVWKRGKKFGLTLRSCRTGRSCGIYYIVPRLTRQGGCSS